MKAEAKRSGRRGDLWSSLILALTSLLGLWAFIRPLVREQPVDLGPSMARTGDAGLLMIVLLGLCLLAVVANLETRRMDSRIVALLGILVALTACLRLISGPMGSSAFFILPILCGYVFGADFGFLLAVLAGLTSAFLTGGMGPWVPFQMFAAGWCGMISGWLPRLRPRRAKWLLSVWGAIAGFLFGFLINLWFWPFLETGVSAGQEWRPGLALRQTFWRYVAFYLATSSWWDAGRAMANAVLLLVLTEPVLRLLERFRKRFSFAFEDS